MIASSYFVREELAGPTQWRYFHDNELIYTKYSYLIAIIPRARSQYDRTMFSSKRVRR